MIHEMVSHRLSNEFRPQAEPQATDIIICTSGNALMVGGEPAAVDFPRGSQLPADGTYLYLFSLDGQQVFWSWQEDRELLPGFAYKTLKEIRWELKGPAHYMYLIYTAWHLIS